MNRLKAHQIEALPLTQLDVTDVPDGYAPVVTGGELTYQPVASAGTAQMPLTSTVAGEPVLVWGSDDSLIPTEVPL